MTAISPVLTTAAPAVFEDEAYNRADSWAGARGRPQKGALSARVVDSVPFRAVGGSGMYRIPTRSRRMAPIDLASSTRTHEFRWHAILGAPARTGHAMLQAPEF